MKKSATIIAQCTPSGPGAIALIRLSGPCAFSIAEAIAYLPSGKSITTLETHTIHYGFIKDGQGQHIDQVLFLLMKAPHTFTGEDTVEITCHNNPFIIQGIIHEALQKGAHTAQKGEFSRQAVENDKMDLIQVEAINDLIHANNQTALKAALGNVKGSFSSFVIKCEKKLIKALAFCEASFEFIDEELGFIDTIIALINDLQKEISLVKDSFSLQQHIKNGVRIAFIGSVNAGKSSLFNALLKKDRAIVTDIPGTTRDSIEAGRYTDGMFQTFIDTAGIRQTDDIVEQKGIERSFEQAALADIIILIFDGSRVLVPSEVTVYELLLAQHASKIIAVLSKRDLPSVFDAQHLSLPPLLSLSVTDTQSIETLDTHIHATIKQTFVTGESLFLLNQRQYDLIESVDNHLKDILTLTRKTVHYEILSYHIQECLTLLSGLTGKSVSEQGMDAVFREFCVGK